MGGVVIDETKTGHRLIVAEVQVKDEGDLTRLD